MSVLVAQDRLGGPQIPELEHLGALKHTARPTVPFDTPRLAAMRPWVSRRCSSTITSALHGAIAWGLALGREERSASPGVAPFRGRFSASVAKWPERGRASPVYL